MRISSPQMALSRVPSKPGRLSFRIWIWFSGLGFAGFLIALVVFANVARQSPENVAQQSPRINRPRSTFRPRTPTVKFNASIPASAASPSSIDCEEVGYPGSYIPLEHQYHPVTTKKKYLQKCRSRYQQHCLWRASNYTPSPAFLKVVRDYEKLHEKCVNGKNLADLMNEGSTPENCNYIVWNDMDGKGNQLISLISAFVYALLTQRVLLISRDAQLQHLLCEPFPRSSWVVPEGIPHVQNRPGEERHGLFYEQAYQDKLAGKETTIPKHLTSSLWHMQQPEDLRFFCEGEQNLLKGVPWLSFWSNNWSGPGLYFVPSFRAKLNEWFPDRAMFLHAGRYLFSPQDDIWERVMRIFKTYMADADRRLAVQIRAWWSEYKPIISKHVLKCAWDQDLLPKVSEFSDSKPDDFSLAGEHIAVVLASLRREYSETFLETFADGKTQGGERVTILSPSAEGEQRTGSIDHERKAISDMWLLSFAEDIISTPKSTFGYVAHGLAGIKPYVLNRYGLDNDNVPDPTCLRSNLPGPCFIDHPRDTPCHLDEPGHDIGDAENSLPEVRHCLLQWGVGIQEEDDRGRG